MDIRESYLQRDEKIRKIRSETAESNISPSKEKNEIISDSYSMEGDIKSLLEGDIKSLLWIRRFLSKHHKWAQQRNPITPSTSW